MPTASVATALDDSNKFTETECAKDVSRLLIEGMSIWGRLTF